MPRYYAVVGTFYQGPNYHRLLEYLRDVSLKELNVITLEQLGYDKEPRGYTRVYNVLIEAALTDPECQVVAVLNDDILPMGPGLIDMLHYVDMHPNVGAAFPVELWLEDGLLTTLAPFTGEKLQGDAALRITQDIEQLFAGFAMAAVKREAWDLAGPLDETLHTYCEDLLFGIRCWETGYRIVNLRNNFFVHERGATTNRLVKEGKFDPKIPEMAAAKLKARYPWLWSGEPIEETMNRLRNMREHALTPKVKV